MTLYAPAMTVVGLAILGFAYVQHTRNRTVGKAEEKTVGSLTDGETTILSGTGHVAPDLSDEPDHDGHAPFTKDRIVAAEYEVEEKDRTDVTWEYEDGGNYAPPFLLDDGTGQLLVMPESYPTVDISSNEETVKVKANREPPTRVQHYLHVVSDFTVEAENRLLGDHRKYTQQIIPDGGEVTVLGAVRDLQNVGAEELGITDRQHRKLLDNGIRFCIDGEADVNIITDGDVSSVARKGWLLSIASAIVGALVLAGGVNWTIAAYL